MAFPPSRARLQFPVTWVPRLSSALLLLLLLIPLPPALAADTVGFPDVPVESSFAEAVAQLSGRGIIRGYPDGRFGPNDVVQRAQVAVMLVRAFGLGGQVPVRDFSDRGSLDPELWTAVRLLADRDIARGHQDGTFHPTDPLTKQQAISFIVRAMVWLGEWLQYPASSPYADVASAHTGDVATYCRFVGAVPGATGVGATALMSADAAATRGWFAEALWGALRLSPDRFPIDPPTGQVYWGAYIPGVPWDMAKLATFEANAGRPVSIVHWGQPWIRAGVWQNFMTSDYQRVRNHGAIPMVDWASWDYAHGPTQPEFRLATVAAGAYDDYIERWAVGARDWGQPFFLRFNWEMNGNWQFPWSEQLNGNQPGDYVRAWRHVHDIFREVGATNITWVWAPNIVGPTTRSLAALYPGDAYVDWVAMDGYNFGTDRDGTWQDFAAIFGETYDQLRELAPGKPIMIAETGCSEDGGNKAEWLRDALEVQLPFRFPAIRALVLMNWNDNDPDLEWPIESSSASLAAYRRGIVSGYYAANGFGALGIAPVPAP